MHTYIFLYTSEDANNWRVGVGGGVLFTNYSILKYVKRKSSFIVGGSAQWCNSLYLVGGKGGGGADLHLREGARGCIIMKGAQSSQMGVPWCEWGAMYPQAPPP